MIKTISVHDLEFDKVPKICYSSRGTTYTKWINTGMPRIPDQMLDSVFFLYKNIEDARKGVDCGGSGFSVVMEYEITHRYQCYLIRHFYAVTNWHVALRDGFSTIRINTHNGGIDFINIEPIDWEFDPKGDDIAIAEIDPDWFNHSLAPIPLRLIASQHELVEKHNIGLGDDVFMLGKFVEMNTSSKNNPTARFGCISSMPYLVKNNMGNLRETYFLDMRSRSGYSGSPVFAYRTPGSNLEYILKNFDPKNPIHYDVSTKLLLLGIHQGQFNEKMRIEGTDNNIIGMSGMTLAVPSWRIFELLQCDKFAQNRKEKDRIYIEQCGPTGAGGFVDESFDVEQSTHQEDFNSLLDAAVKEKPSTD